MNVIINGIENLINTENIKNEEIKTLINNIRNIDILNLRKLDYMRL